MLINTSAQCPTAQPILTRKTLIQSPVRPMPEPVVIVTDYALGLTTSQQVMAKQTAQSQNSLQRSAQQLIQFKKNQTKFSARLDLR